VAAPRAAPFPPNRLSFYVEVCRASICSLRTPFCQRLIREHTFLSRSIGEVIRDESDERG
jgi:hypothetical protein